MLQENPDAPEQVAMETGRRMIYRYVFEERRRQPEQVLREFIQALAAEPPMFSPSAHLYRASLRRTTAARALQLIADISPDWQTFREFSQSFSQELRSERRPLLASVLETFLTDFPEQWPASNNANCGLDRMIPDLGPFPILYLARCESTLNEVRDAGKKLRQLVLPLIAELRAGQRNALYGNLTSLRTALYPEGYAFMVVPEHISEDDNEEIWTQKHLSAVIGMLPLEAGN